MPNNPAKALPEKVNVIGTLLSKVRSTLLRGRPGTLEYQYPLVAVAVMPSYSHGFFSHESPVGSLVYEAVEIEAFVTSFSHSV